MHHISLSLLLAFDAFVCTPLSSSKLWNFIDLSKLPSSRREPATRYTPHLSQRPICILAQSTKEWCTKWFVSKGHLFLPAQISFPTGQKHSLGPLWTDYVELSWLCYRIQRWRHPSWVQRPRQKLVLFLTRLYWTSGKCQFWSRTRRPWL